MTAAAGLNPPPGANPVAVHALDDEERVRAARAARYARCVKMSKKVEWQIDTDVIRGRDLDFSRPFLPDGLTFVDRLPFLGAAEVRLMSQLQGRSYANLFRLVERYISAKMLDLSREHALGDQVAFEGLVRFSNEEIKHQELFRRIEALIDAGMPPGYVETLAPNDVARAVLGRSTWSILALTCHVELIVQAHYDQSIAPREDICPLWKDVLFYHWQDECQHVMLDELEWTAVHARLSPEERERAVEDFIQLVAAMDGTLRAQSRADAEYFLRVAGRPFSAAECQQVRATLLAASRWQFLVSGLQHAHFGRLLASMTTTAQRARIQAAFQPIIEGKTR